MLPIIMCTLRSSDEGKQWHEVFSYVLILTFQQLVANKYFSLLF